MDVEITVSKALRMRDCGLDEGWLQGQIEKDTSILGLGDLEVVRREKRQSSGGRLDFLLQNLDDNSMYEVEMMLGETDESHIIRTIEYWDLERRLWPKRSHTAVLVAEHMNRRFFNVIQLISLTIPIIAIQANLVEADGKRFLHFTKILEAYQEPELQEPAPSERVDEKYCQEKSSWTLAHAKTLQGLFSSVLGEMKLRLNKHEIRLLHGGETYFLLDSRISGKSSFRVWLKSAEMPDAAAVLDNAHISFVEKPYDSDWRTIRMTVDQSSIQENADLLKEIAKLSMRSWQKTGEN
jgi:hypothetical protein